MCVLATREGVVPTSGTRTGRNWVWNDSVGLKCEHKYVADGRRT